MVKEVKTYKVVVETGYVGVDLEFEFDLYEDDTPTYNDVKRALLNNLFWHVEDEEGNEVEL